MIIIIISCGSNQQKRKRVNEEKVEEIRKKISIAKSEVETPNNLAKLLNTLQSILDTYPNVLWRPKLGLLSIRTNFIGPGNAHPHDSPPCLL